MPATTVPPRQRTLATRLPRSPVCASTTDAWRRWPGSWTSPRLRTSTDALHRVQTDAAMVVLDQRELEFADCRGGHLSLTGARRPPGPRGWLVGVRGPAEVESLFALIGIDRCPKLVDQSHAPARARSTSTVVEGVPA